MPNIQQILKEEISRLARKEIKAQMSGTVKQVALYRKEIVALKREVAGLQRQIASLEKSNKRMSTAKVETAADGQAAMKGISGKRIASKRKALEISAADFAKLVGASMQSVYFWEQGRTKPRNAQLVKLHEIMGIGKREANRRLEEIG
ncbi:transcriptional repressor DicA [Poriferisphaera corsica]|uniref:Transcriptional repressor DicA n=1 Tax=Poriferisphaera corsica TaxID=2528020 RepID=A0A517YQQ3_9BACT|nr:helix-turn-helix transcriptional regulator [Poriferisphaera corsica]QDU32544.1 transcriptional repressor DicA [Poriferisphaera corsica]